MCRARQEPVFGCYPASPATLPPGRHCLLHGGGTEHPGPPHFYQHVGLYAYRREFLLGLAAMPPSKLEKAEKLEQLRVLEAGYPIVVGVVDEPTFGIDTAEDYRAFVERHRAG